MLTPDDINYAIENTKVVLAPRAKLKTFGTSVVNYYLVTEDMDAANASRVREGRIQAEKPELLTPAHFRRLLLEGFVDEKAEEFAHALSQNPELFTWLKYGFKVRKDEIRSYDVHESLELVVDRVKADAEGRDDPLTAVLTGIDDGWEVCLLKFMVDVIQESAGGHLDDFRERGLL
ncbi:MAG: hypothetical protein AAGK14_01130 [Verrucomicrobiota bacterium]